MSIDEMKLSINLDSFEFDKVMRRINQEMQNVIKTSADMSAKIQQTVSSISDAVDKKKDGLFMGIQQMVSSILDAVDEKKDSLFSGIENMLPDTIKNNENIIQMISSISETIDKEKDNLFSGVLQMVSSLSNAIDQEKDGLFAGVQQITSSVPGILEIIGIESEGFINGLIEKFSTGTEEILEKLINFKDIIANEVLAEFTTLFSESFDMMFTDAGAAWENFSNGIKNIFSNLWKNVSVMLKKALEEMLAQELVAYAKEKAITAGRVLLNAVIAGSDAAAKDPNPYTKIATGLLVFAGVAALAAKLAGAFAEGGIIGGTSFSGDALFARVNSGEMILNKQQQSNLWHLANSRGFATGKNASANIIQNIEVNASERDLSVLTEAIRKGTLDALEFAGVAYNVGAKQSGVAL